jgi:hypothetical protein
MQNVFRFRLLIATVLCVLHLWSAFAAAQQRDPRSGLYAIWYSRSADMFLNQPYIVGGQIVLQWADVEPEPGVYDFTAIDPQLADFARRGQYTTLQINGNLKPAWLFQRVPYVEERLSVQVSNRQGTLMYWHPAHRDAYLAMLRALADHLGRTADRRALLGIRMNLNALGTEHHHVPAPFAVPEKWVVPDGVDRTALTAWSRPVDDAYVQAVVDTYLTSFPDGIRIFVRNNLGDEILAAYEQQFAAGRLSWFHTSSEVEPRATFAEKKYQRFYEYCRSGKTTAYAEPWASAWGHHGGQTDDRWCSPPQWNYWRLLFDLHCGVSHIALYSADMRVAIEGQYHAQGVDLDDPGGAYQAEFDAAFRFAAKYAGFHASPATSPGAWVAFRENDVVRAANGMPEERRKLSIFTGDYNFLMQRLPDDASEGLGVVNIGPDEQRYGAWARRLPAGARMRLTLDAEFAASLAATGAVIRTVCLDDSHGSFEVKINDRVTRTDLTGTGRWREFPWPVPARDWSSSKPVPIVIQAGKAPIYLHLIEVQRGTASDLQQVDRDSRDGDTTP